MPQLQSISSLPRDAVDLLEAVGYMNAQELCESNTSDLIDELIKANGALQIMPAAPTLDQLLDWKGFAEDSLGGEFVRAEVVAVDEDLVGEQPQDAESSAPDPFADSLGGSFDRDGVSEDAEPSFANFEHDPEVQSMLEMSPDAELISPELIKRNQLAVSAIPEGILLTECQGDVEMNVMSSQRLRDQERRAVEIKRSGLMTSRIRSFEDAESDDHHVKPLEKGEQREVVSLSKGLNAGVNPRSRRFVRGVLHPDPMRVRVSAFFALLVQSLLILTVFAVPALIAYDLVYDIPELIWWVVGLVSVLLLSALCYLFWGISARCHVCGQRQFAPKKCLKNRKAHHFALIGYIFPTALHALFYKWFYCTYCGTAVRLKK